MFAGRGASRTDQPNSVVPLREPNRQQSAAAGEANREVTIFIIRMIAIVIRIGATVHKDGCCVLECNAVLFSIAGGLSVVPFEFQSANTIPHPQSFLRFSGSSKAYFVPALSTKLKP